MIILKRLRWDNCFSYGEGNELLLDENNVTQLIGTNGMGKSSIPLIIEEALYNKNSKGIKKADIPNRYVKNGYDIYLSWERDGDLYEITVNRKTGIKVKLEKNGEDISSHTATGTYKTVQDVLGIDFKTFSQLVYQNTNSSLQFLTATDTNRKKFLIDLLNLQEYVKLFDVFKNAAKEISSEIVGIESSVATIEKWLRDNKLGDTTILPMLNLEIETGPDEKQLRHLMTELSNISERNKKIIENNQYKSLLRQIDLREIQHPKITVKQSYDEHQSELGRVRSAIRTAEQMIKKVEKLEDKCPTCEQDIDASFLMKLIQKERETLDSSVVLEKELIKRIQKIKDDNLEVERLQKKQKEWEELYRSVDNDLPSETLDKDTLEKEVKDLEKTIANAKMEIKAIEAENQKRTKHNTRIQVILEQTDDFLDQLKVKHDLLTEYTKLLSNLEILKKAFSTNGLLAYKIENLVKELEELVNQYLAEFSDGRFTLQFVVNNDKLNVEITDDGETVDILALSSGELARVNISTLLAIRKLMSSISSSRLNILFLDEVINVLDEVGKEKLIELLTEEQELNTYVVSHGWEHPLLAKVIVQKEDNISKLIW